MPFSVEQFLAVFAAYNTAIWPLQIVTYLLGFVALIMVMKNHEISGKIVSLILAGYWTWMGISYHWLFFTAINQAAYLFGALFVIEALMFLHYGVIRHRLLFRLQNPTFNIVSILLVLYSMLIYPVLGIFMGHTYPHSPVFGVAPCPTTIFTFAMFLLLTPDFPKRLLIIPGLWSLMGLSAAFSLGIFEDIGLFVAGFGSISMLLLRERRFRKRAM